MKKGQELEVKADTDQPGNKSSGDEAMAAKTEERKVEVNVA